MAGESCLRRRGSIHTPVKSTVIRIAKFRCIITRCKIYSCYLTETPNRSSLWLLNNISFVFFVVVEDLKLESENVDLCGAMITRECGLRKSYGMREWNFNILNPRQQPLHKLEGYTATSTLHRRIPLPSNILLYSTCNSVTPKPFQPYSLRNGHKNYALGTISKDKTLNWNWWISFSI